MNIKWTDKITNKELESPIRSQ